MMANPHLLIEGAAITAYAIRAEPRVHLRPRRGAARDPAAAATRSQEACAAGYLGQNILGSGFDLEVIIHAGAGAYICGEETALLTSLEGYRGLPRLQAAVPGRGGPVRLPDGDQQRGVDRQRSVDRGRTARTGSATSARRSPRASASSTLSGHVSTPGQYEAPLGITLRELLDLAGGIRAGHRLKFWTAGRLVDADTHRPAPRRTAGLRVGRGRRIHARHQGAADLRRHHLRGRRGAPLDRVLSSTSRAGNARRAVRARSGWSACWNGWNMARAPRRPREAPGHLRQHHRPRVLRPRRRRDAARSPRPSSYFRDEFIQHHKEGGCPFDPAASTVWSQSMTVETTQDTVTVTIDGFEIAVPKGTWMIRAAETARHRRSRGSATTRCSTRSAPAASAWSRWKASASRWPRASPRAPRAWWCTPSSPPRSRRRRSGA